MISIKTLLAGTVAAFMTTGVASAGSITFTDIFGVTATDYSGVTLSVPQYDGSLGQLQSIDFVLNGLVEATASAENTDATSKVIELDLGAEITASTSTISALASVLPLASETFNAVAFDGSIDFGGESGVRFGSLSASGSDMRTLTGSEMDEFIGAGFVDIFIAAVGTSEAVAPGDIISELFTFAGADVEVTYNFGTDVPAPGAEVPVPAALPLLLGGMGALYAIRRRQKAAA